MCSIEWRYYQWPWVTLNYPPNHRIFAILYHFICCHPNDISGTAEPSIVKFCMQVDCKFPAYCDKPSLKGAWSESRDPFLGRLPNFGSRPNNMGVKFPSVRPSTKSFFDFDEIWYTGSTRWQKHNGMTLTRIQGQGQAHRDSKVAKSPKFKVYFLRQNSINLKTDGRLLHYRTISKTSQVFLIRPCFPSRDLWTLVLTTSDKLFS